MCVPASTKDGLRDTHGTPCSAGGRVPALPTPLRCARVGDGRPSAPSAQGTWGCRRRRPEGQEVPKDVQSVLPRRRMQNRSWGTWARGTLGEMRCPRAGRMLPIGLHRHHVAWRLCPHPRPGACVRAHVCDGRSVTAAFRGVPPRRCLAREGARLALSILDQPLGLPDLQNLPARCRQRWQGHPLLQPRPQSPQNKKIRSLTANTSYGSCKVSSVVVV